MILSDYLENKLLDHLLKNTAYTQPALYFALFTADPGESGVTSELTIGANGYTRKLVTNDNTNFPPCAVTGSATKTNATTIIFPTCATAAWGTITHWALYDASTAGNMLAHGALAESRTVAVGDSPKFAIGTLAITAANTSGGGLTEFAKRKLLDHVFGGPAYTPAATIYTGLLIGYTDEATVEEWADASYARQATAFDSAASGATKNAAQEDYSADVVTAAIEITHFAVYDSLTSGNLLAVGPLSSSFTVAADDTVSLADEAFTVTFQ